MFKRNGTRSTEELASDLGDLVEQGRALLAEAAGNSGRGMQRMRGTLNDTLSDLSDRMGDWQTTAARAARRGAKYARQADDYIHDNPWPVVAGGIFLGVMATLWWNQRR